ncbi:MAG: MCE family protein [Rhodobacteraceae bacterium]|nr:MCE family protein [Paracoccaceae bacterium]
METRANYILIGLFTLAGIVGLFGFLLWLAKVEVNRQYAYYDVLFDNVAGLATAGDVRFNGLPVGQVVGLDLDEEDPSKVRVRLEIAADTPIKIDTIAQLQSQGVTGVSYVGLSGGTPSSDPLPQFGEIQSRRSPLQTIFEGAPELLTKAVDLLEDVQSVVNQENRDAVSTLLENLASASARLDSALSDFETLSRDLGNAATEIAAFTGRLEQLSDTAEETLTTATRTLDSARGAADTAVGTLDTAREAFATADGLMQNELKGFIESGARAADTLDTTVQTLEPAVAETVTAARDLIETRLPGLTTQVQDTARVLEEQITSLGTDASALIARYDEVGQSAQARLDQTENVIANFDAATVEAKAALTTINAAVQQDLPGLMEELHAAAQTANRVIEDVGTQVSDVAGRLGTLSEDGSKALTTATDTFENANETLAAITSAMDSAEETLGVANTTFASANRVINQDLDGIISDVRTAATRFSEAVTRVADNADAISDEVLSASQSASNLVGTVDGIIQENRRQVSGFLRAGLPELQRFVEESRRLVVNLERLVDRVERDPARFLLGTQASEFRR